MATATIKHNFLVKFHEKFLKKSFFSIPTVKNISWVWPIFNGEGRKGKQRIFYFRHKILINTDKEISNNYLN